MPDEPNAPNAPGTPSQPAPPPSGPRRSSASAPASSPGAASASASSPDAAIDRAMDAALGGASSQAAAELPLKKQWDDELEAELEAALSGFDPHAFDVAPARRTREQRLPADSKGRGQESQQGLRKGRVIGVRGRSLFIDLGGKSEGVVPLDQFEGEFPAAGSEIEVQFDHFDRSEGIVHLRLKGAAIEADWSNLREGVIVEAKITKAVKGGVEVDVDGIRGFMPISQIDLNRVEDASDYINQKVKAVVTEADQREKNLVVSRRDLLERERAELREKTWETLEEGQIRDGVVRSVKPFGAFVDVGGVDGLLPIGEMSWIRVEKVDDLIRPGDKVQVQILRIDRETRKLTFGLKQLQKNPWDDADDNYARGATIRGKVTKIMEFGAFVELEPGVEGLIHVSELSPTRVRRIADVVQPGQEVEVRILKVESDARRISLSLLPLAAKDQAEEEDVEDDDAPPVPKPERKIPLKGGLGDGDPLFPKLGS
ncbi:30S ribosomal protein S1 [Planctomyces sp. SH-PL62]|uniref:30S ribosomal protein S1 n=1 Tax=Planctomyces sp. SH-PL62 TaxID=1636152 RepID=UPI00078DE2D3|nr:S1 RNA-binding domain-containing protein [Planctomyces sp. SH-PL62]AMV39964.1 30S ribosomal protein S1 [Planctomyces sp. SH-PL62]